MTRALSVAIGLLMVAAGTVHSTGPALVAASAALFAVVVSLVSSVAATLAVVATVAALALSAPSPALAALAGVAATAYLALWHAAGHPPTSLTPPTLLGAVGLSAVAVLATTVPLTLPWVPLVAPLAVVAIYVTVVDQYVG